MAIIKSTDLWQPSEQQKKTLKYIGKGYKVFYGGARGGGKLSPLDSNVLTPKGYVKMGDIRIGQQVTDPVTGGSCKVIAIHPQGVKTIYRLTFDDGASLEVGEEHLWAYRLANYHKPGSKEAQQREFAKTTLKSDDGTKRSRFDSYRVGTTSEVIEYFNSGKGVRIPLTEPVLFTANGRTGKGNVEPYLVGLLLGDGYCGNMSITSCDDEIRDYLVQQGFTACASSLHPDGKPRTYLAVGAIRKALDQWLRNNNLKSARSWEKRMPPYILTSNLEYRLAVLQGLMDTDGTIDERGRAYFCSTSKQLAEDVQWIVRSLGGKARIRERVTRYTHNGEKRDGRVSFNVRIWLKQSSALFRLTRKKERATNSWNGGSEMTRELVSVECIGGKESQCITVSSPHGLYVGDDFVVTHNSNLILWSAVFACLQHKELRTAIFRSNIPELERYMVPYFLDSVPQEFYVWNEKKKVATFKNGSRLYFIGLESERDASKIKGTEFGYICIDEANEMSLGLIHRITGSLRSVTAENFTPTLLMTGNPGGVSDDWFKKHFIRPQYEYWTEGELKDKDSYIFIPAFVQDNPNKNFVEEYTKTLDSLPPDLREAWLLGSWDSFTGQFFEEWNPQQHIVTPFTIPENWMRVGGLDLGYGQHPTVMLWMAQNPETNEVFVYREYAQKGVTEEHIENIKMMQDPKEYLVATYADPAMWIERRDTFQAESPARMFLNAGMPLEPASNTRVPGWSVVKQWLHWSGEKPPKLKVFSNCQHLIDTLPQLRYSKSTRTHAGMDLDTKQADDAADALRYGLVGGFGYPIEGPPRKIYDREKLNQHDKERYGNNRLEGQFNTPEILNRLRIRSARNNNLYA